MTQRKVLLSLPWTTSWADVPPGLPPGVTVTLLFRMNDLGASRFKKLMLLGVNLWKMLRTGWSQDRIVVCTSMANAAAAAVVLRLRPRVQLVVWDFLMPKDPWVARCARLALRRVDLWLVIRRGDERTFTERLGAGRCDFVPFPAPPPRDVDEPQQDFVYAAGSAHRDWPTLIEAAERANVRTIISTNDVLEHAPKPGSVVSVMPLASPADGRRLMAQAAAVCVPLKDTQLPSGPLILLDAMSAGKALITSGVNGARDYVIDDVNALVTRPGDVTGLERALRAVASDLALRERLGKAGRETARDLDPAAIFQLVCLRGAPWID